MKIVSVFTSIEGEGLYMGTPTTFLRVGGCNLKCPWCDTPSGLDPNKWVECTVEEVAELLRQQRTRYPHVHRLSITGGEPTLQADDVVKVATEASWHYTHINLETNGTNFVPTLFEAVSDLTVSPKLGKVHKYGSALVRKFVGLIPQLRPKVTWKFVIGSLGDLALLESWLTVIQRDQQPIVLQPDNGFWTGLRYGPEWLDWYAKQLNDLAKATLEGFGGNIRVLPQMHTLMWGKQENV